MNILANALRILRLYAIAIWVGGLVFFVVVAQVAFSTLPSTHEAGMVVRGSLLMLHNIGTIAGFVYLIATVLLLGLGERGKLRFVELALVAIMIGLTDYSQFSIMPHMERDRTALGGEVDPSTKDAPAHIDFDRLHNVSTQVEGGVLLCGLVVLALAAKSKE
jgi:putative copper export protein